MDTGLHKKLADDLAETLDAIVILYDPFDGKPLLSVPDSDDGRPQQVGLNWFTVRFMTALIFQGKATIQANDWATTIKPLWMDQLIPYLESKGCGDQFAMMGFCFGCWIVLQASQDTDLAHRVTCGVSFHPSVEGVEQAFGNIHGDIDLCHRCRTPQMVHATKSESVAWKPDGAAHQALQLNTNVAEVQFRQAPLTESHGFMTRADIFANESSRQAVEEGMDLAVQFIQEYSSH